MGIFDSFTKDGRKSKALQKKISTVANRRAADEDRYIAYEALAEDGSDEAVYGLLLRFTYVKDIGQRSRSTDEEDKRYVHDLVVNLGEKALGAVKRFLLAREGPVGAPKHTISWALRILDRIVPSVELHWEIIKEVLDDNEPGYEKNPSRKLDLMTYLGGLDRFDSTAVAEVVSGYLEDSDEGVRFAAAGEYELVIQASGSEAAGELPIVQVGLDNEPIGDLQLEKPGWHALRLKATVAEGEHDVSLSFTNDFYEPPADRNLRIRSLTIRPAQSE